MSQVGVLAKGVHRSSWFFGIEASFDLSYTVLLFWYLHK